MSRDIQITTTTQEGDLERKEKNQAIMCYYSLL